MARPTLSLRARLLAGMGVVAVVLVVVSAVVTSTTRSRLIDQVDERLTTFAPTERDLDRIAALPDPADVAPPGAPVPPDPPPDGFRDRVSDVYEGYVTPDGTLVTRFAPNLGSTDLGAPAIDVADLPGAGSEFATVDAVDGSATYRVVTTRLGEVVTVTGVPLDDVEDTIGRLIVVEVIGSLVILAALATVAWWMLRLGIRPVQEMTESALRISNGELDERVPETSPGTETGDLAIALNRMLGTINAALVQQASSEERLRRFVADASHELRTPVTTIQGYAELYRHGGLDDRDALDDAMRRTRDEAARMGRLVDDMLTLAKLDQERPLDRRTVDLTALARDAVDDARAVAPDRDVTLDAGAETLVEADEDRVRQAVANVLGNALVHTAAGVAVEVAVRSNGDRAVLSVRDHGDGMPDEAADRATERFYRADPARARRRGGSGLGLSIVDAAVRAHGGTVSVDSVVGEGTTVTIELPLARPG